MALVIAGKLLIDTAKKSGATILPIDSEHSAVFQALQAGKADEVNKVILTASGGPFRNADPEQLEKATLDDALAHPTPMIHPQNQSFVKENAILGVTFEHVERAVDNAVGYVRRLHQLLYEGSVRIDWLFERGPDGYFPTEVFD